MKKYIYQILNKVNGKCYVGQTKDYKKRILQHRTALNSNKHENKYLQFSWNKYGEKNFEFNLLEELSDNYNDLEKYWISKLNCLIPSGYNVLPGGEEPPILKGDNSYRKKISESQAEIIKNLLLNNIDVKEIQKEFPSITTGQINRINNGEAWFDSQLDYPLQERLNVGHDIVENIQNDLLNTKETQNAIAKKYGVCRTFVTGINNGVYKEYKTLNKYPIRERGVKEITQDLFDRIFNELVNTTKSQNEIAKEFNVSKDIVTAINLGNHKRSKDIKYEYPIRTRRKYT